MARTRKRASRKGKQPAAQSPAWPNTTFSTSKDAAEFARILLQSTRSFVPMAGDLDPLRKWLEVRSHEWSIALALRAALRAFPFVRIETSLETVMSAFRAMAIGRLAIMYPAIAIPAVALDQAYGAIFALEGNRGYAASAVAYAVDCAGNLIDNPASCEKYAAKDGAYAISDAVHAERKEIVDAFGPASYSGIIEAALVRDVRCLLDGELSVQDLLRQPLWTSDSPPEQIGQAWQRLTEHLTRQGDHWSIWIDWYESVMHGGLGEGDIEAAFTDIPGRLPWDASPDAVNCEIARRLGKFRSSSAPVPLDGLLSAISVHQTSDGRIGIEPGPFSLPSTPLPSSADDHRRASEACRSRAGHLREAAFSPRFQGRLDYAELLAAYCKWLPDERGKGNILLADGDARALNKLFAVDRDILPAAFASQLSVLLEDHIALRAFYPELERHYHAVRTGRIIAPLPRDAVEKLRKIVREQTPIVFEETLGPAIDEAARPPSDLKRLEDAHFAGSDSTSPIPPVDPVAAPDPEKSRNYTLAALYNRIYLLLMKGKDTAQALEGWKKTYEMFKPYIGSIIEFLKHWQGDGPGRPPLPPTIGV